MPELTSPDIADQNVCFASPVVEEERPVFQPIAVDLSAAYVEYLQHELHMQRLLVRFPHLRTLLALRTEPLHWQGRVTFDSEAAVDLFHKAEPSTAP